MRSDGPPASGGIERKIAWAERVAATWGARLSGTPPLSELFARFNDAVRASRLEMANTGLAALCRRCEEEEGGSCCGAGLEDRYDSWLLLTNLLLGVSLPRKRHKSGSCFFLLDQGCCLQARHTICVNYICKKILDRIDPRAIGILREKEGVELDTLFLLHEEIKRAVEKVGRSGS